MVSISCIVSFGRGPKSSAAAFSVACFAFFAPGSGRMLGAFASSQHSAPCVKLLPPTLIRSRIASSCFAYSADALPSVK